MNLIEYNDKDQMMRDVASVLINDLTAALSRNDRVSFAVPGGTTPGPIFDQLSETEIDWDRVDILLTDERWFPGDHPRSNTQLLNERLLTDAAAHANYLSLYTGDDDPVVGAAAVSHDVARLAPLSVVLLGMGGDMHTASLFPMAQNLDIAVADDAPAVVAIIGGGAPEPRVSLSVPILRSAQSRHLVITGIEKRNALDKALELNDPMIAPISAVLAGTTVHWAG